MTAFPIIVSVVLQRDNVMPIRSHSWTQFIDMFLKYVEQHVKTCINTPVNKPFI